MMPLGESSNAMDDSSDAPGHGGFEALGFPTFAWKGSR